MMLVLHVPVVTLLRFERLSSKGICHLRESRAELAFKNSLNGSLIKRH